MLNRLNVAAAILIFGLRPLATLADDDGKTADKAQAAGGDKKPSAKKDVSSASAEPLKETLQKALKQIKALDEEAAKSDRETRLPSPSMRAMRFEKALEADVMRAIGCAQAKIGSLEDARATWQTALDTTNEISSFDAAEERANLYLEIARAQYVAGEQNEARFNLRQAVQSVRAVKAQTMFPLEAPTGMEDRFDPLSKKAELLRRIAQLQAETGNKEGSEESFRLAVESTESIKEPLRQIRHLLAIAQARVGVAAVGVWAKCLDFALSVKEEYPRGKAVESVIRARLNSLPADETVAIVADRLKGDFQHYAIWVVADAMASSDKPFPSQAVARLGQLASKAEFDRPSKKIHVFQRIAEAQARLGDYEGAYKTAGEPHPVNDVQNFRATQARVHVMKSIAEAQLNAKQVKNAKDTVQMALELISPLPDEDAEAYFPLAELCLLQAKAGDVAGALETVSAVSSSAWRVSILTEIAASHAEAGRKDEAHKTLRLALDASRGAPNDALWASSSSPLEEMIDPSLPVLETLAHAQARIGDVEAAMKTIAGMNQSTMGIYSRVQCVKQIVTTLLEKSDIAAARLTVELIADSGSFTDSKADVVEQIAKRQAEQGDAAGALAWAVQLRIPGTKLHALRGMADGVVQRCTVQSSKSSGSATSPTATK